MKTKHLILVVLSALIFGGWATYRPNFNTPVSFKLAPAGSSIIPMMFKRVDGIHISNIMTNLNDKGYSHIKVVNDIATALEITTSDSAEAPSSTSSQILYVPASSSAEWNDISVFQYLYVQSGGSSLSTGTAKVMVW